MITNENVLIKVDNLKKSFGEVEVLKGISTEIKKGDVVVVRPAGGARGGGGLATSSRPPRIIMLSLRFLKASKFETKA